MTHKKSKQKSKKLECVKEESNDSSQTNFGNFNSTLKSYKHDSVVSQDKNHLSKFECSVNIPSVSVDKKSSVFNKIDINSISVRKFNLDGCDDCHPPIFEKVGESHVKRVCLPILAQDILDSFNLLDLGSSASKSTFNQAEFSIEKS